MLIDTSNDMTTDATAHTRWRRRVWTAVVALAVLLLLALTPPLLNVNRLQRRIAASMSASLGRPVHLDRVTMHVLPVPGFTLENLVVSEDAAFGEEPIIRANKVDVTLRISSLWRRQVELSSVRFDVDDQGSGPNLNLVRNAQGHWNLQSLLMHAAAVSAAPTAQQQPGPEPRFPYIEATGARVSVKLEDEKQPFALTETDLALWLPSPQQWRVRLEGRPARTDTNISDPGMVRLEGSLERAANMAEVPVDLHASWHDAPLGEATKLLTGNDAGWRGGITVEATLLGKLGAAKLSTNVHLSDLRRAEFVPAKSLDVQVDCTGTLEVPTAIVRMPSCAVPAEKISAIADSVDLSRLTATGVQIGSPGTSEELLVNLLRLFSQRIPAKHNAGGTLAGSFTLPQTGRGDAWQGEVHGDLDPLLPWPQPAVSQAFSVTAHDGGWDLAPVNLLPAGKTLLLSGTATRESFTLHLAGAATGEEISQLRAQMPPLGDGLSEAVPELAVDARTPAKIDVTCTRTWNAGQTCKTSAAIAPVKRSARHGRR